MTNNGGEWSSDFAQKFVPEIVKIEPEGMTFVEESTAHPSHSLLQLLRPLAQSNSAAVIASQAATLLTTAAETHATVTTTAAATFLQNLSTTTSAAAAFNTLAEVENSVINDGVIATAITTGCNDMNAMLWDSRQDLTTQPSVAFLFALLYTMIISLGVVGNVGVLLAIARTRSLQTVPNMFIFSLSCSDIVVCFTSATITPFTAFNKSWIFGPVICSVAPVIAGMSLCFSTFTLAAISLDRFLMIRFPTKKQLTHAQTLAIIAAICLLAAMLSVPAAFAHTLRAVDEFCGVFCFEDWGPDGAGPRRAYGFLMLTVQFLIPLSLITFCYTAISIRLGKSLVLRKKKEIEGIKGKCTTEWSVPVSEQQRNATKRRQRTNRMFIGMVVAFSLSWIWSVMYNLLRDLEGLPEFVRKQEFLVGISTHCIAMSSTVWNPILYALLNLQLRAAFLQLLPSWLKRCLHLAAFEGAETTTAATPRPFLAARNGKFGGGMVTAATTTNGHSPNTLVSFGNGTQSTNTMHQQQNKAIYDCKNGIVTPVCVQLQRKESKRQSNGVLATSNNRQFVVVRTLNPLDEEQVSDPKHYVQKNGSVKRNGNSSIRSNGRSERVSPTLLQQRREQEPDRRMSLGNPQLLRQNSKKRSSATMVSYRSRRKSSYQYLEKKRWCENGVPTNFNHKYNLQHRQHNFDTNFIRSNDGFVSEKRLISIPSRKMSLQIQDQQQQQHSAGRYEQFEPIMNAFSVSEKQQVNYMNNDGNSGDEEQMPLLSTPNSGQSSPSSADNQTSTCSGSITPNENDQIL